MKRATPTPIPSAGRVVTTWTSTDEAQYKRQVWLIVALSAGFLLLVYGSLEVFVGHPAVAASSCQEALQAALQACEKL